MPPTRLPLVIRLGGIRSLLSFCAIMTAGLAAALSPVAVAVWAPSLAALTLLPALLGAGGVTYYLWRGLSARRMFKQALRHYAQVTDGYEATELHARLIPEGETRGARVMAHYHWFRDEYESLTRSWQDLGSPGAPSGSNRECSSGSVRSSSARPHWTRPTTSSPATPRS